MGVSFVSYCICCCVNMGAVVGTVHGFVNMGAGARSWLDFVNTGARVGPLLGFINLGSIIFTLFAVTLLIKVVHF